MPQYLVTGGAGFNGSRLTAALVARGDHVVVLDDLSGGSRTRVPHGGELATASVADEVSVSGLFRAHRFDGVFHLVAFAAEGISHAVKSLNYTANVLGIINIINSALRAKVDFIGFASSVAVYGHGTTPMRETDVPYPADSYGNAKLAIEADEPRAWGQVFNVGSSTTSTVLHLADTVRHAMCVPNHPIIRLPARDEARIAYTDSSHAKGIVGAWPETCLADGITRIATWARDHGPVDLASIVRIEVPYGDGAGWVGWVTDRLNGGSDARPAVAEGAV